MAHTTFSANALVPQPHHEALLANHHLYEGQNGSLLSPEDAFVTLKRPGPLNYSDFIPEVSDTASAYSDDVVLAMASLAHQIRSPIMAAGIYAEQLKASADPQQTEWSDRIIHNLQGISDHLEELMQMAKGTQDSDQTFLLADFVCEMHQEAKAWSCLSTVSIRWVSQLHQDMIVCRARRKTLQGALQNVLQNAAQSRTGLVNVQCTLVLNRDGNLLIRISDDGPGLAEAQRQSLFTPYASGREGGHGLGLSFARQIARSHDGELRLSHTSPRGSCFEFELPICCSPELGAVLPAQPACAEE